jgi:predicted metal-dependent peptidase
MEREIAGFRGTLFSKHPFWAIISARLKVEICRDGSYMGKSIPTAATNGEMIVFNFDWIKNIPFKQREAVFMHEVCHVALGHPLRRGNRSQANWNIAGDHEVNLMLKEMGYHIDKWLCDPKFTGMSAERIHYILSNEAKQEQQDSQQDSDQQDQSGGGDSEDNSEDNSGEQSEEDSGDEPGQSSGGDSDEQSGDQAGLSDDDQSGDEAGSAAPGDGSGQGEGQVGQIWDAEGPQGQELTESEKQERMVDLTRDITSAEMMQKTCGLGAGPLAQRSIDRLTKPKMDWRRKMSNFVRNCGKPKGRTWSKLDRRSLQRGTYQPGQIKEGIGWMVYAVDISGSMSFPEFCASMDHLDKIRKSMAIDRITILPFNEIVLQNDIIEVSPKDKTPRNFRTGGGTQFSPIFNWVARQKTSPDCIMVFTDLCCNDWGDKPKAPVMWVSTDEVYESSLGWYSNKPPFGDVVHVDLSREDS